ncbi:neural cell adhesion molecule 1 isoform X2 [Conger conger]|uniref:neural cell adhesion molecule 1 isoform X2 n=1 Tax=Conger conger TaxID=82655 RepID=UPI002A59FBFF|nr:neural cell adhesion molecule 1 isoform X2 [Conger conger]
MAEVRLSFDFVVVLLLQLSLCARPSQLQATELKIIPNTEDIAMESNHMLLCKAETEGRMSWRKNGEEIDERRLEIEIVDEASLKLTIPKVRIEDSGTYTCHSDFDDGKTATKKIDLHVYQRPTFGSTLTYHEFLEGQNAVLPCAATGLPAVEVKWRKATDERITVLPDNSLNITKIGRKQHGNYYCIATIKNRQISEELAISVVVNVPPTAEIHQKEKKVLAGPRTNVTISCLVTGVPTPNISWTSPPMSDDSRYKFNSDRSELTIPAVVRSDFGEYACVAKNKIGESRANFVLDVTVHPTVSLNKAVMVVESGKNASVTCEGSGHPPPKFHWVQKGTNVKLTSSSVRVRAVGPTLGFGEVQPSDGGVYTCVGSNDVGNDTQDFSLETWPGSPSQINVSAGPASVHFHLDAPVVDGGTPITQYVLEWRQDGEPSWAQRDVQATEPLVLPSLKPYTSYHVRMAAKNRLGQGQFSREHSIRTLSKREPDSPILMDSEVQVEKNSVSIPIMQLDDGGTAIIHYVVRYRPDSEDQAWLEMQLPANATGIHLAGLQYNASYHLEVVAVNPLGSSSPAYFSFGVPQATAVPKTTMGKGGVVAIVLLIFLVLLIAVDATCCYVNRCGLLMYLAVKLLGEKAPGVKTVEDGNGEINIVDVKLNGLRAQRGSFPKQQPPNGAQMEVTSDKAPLTKFEKAPPACGPATEA